MNDNLEVDFDVHTELFFRKVAMAWPQRSLGQRLIVKIHLEKESLDFIKVGLYFLTKWLAEARDVAC
jgi:hypothetical protein